GSAGHSYRSSACPRSKSCFARGRAWRPSIRLRELVPEGRSSCVARARSCEREIRIEIQEDRRDGARSRDLDARCWARSTRFVMGRGETVRVAARGKSEEGGFLGC